MIDSHHHFWRYNPVEYDWIGDDMAALRRDFLPHALEAQIEVAGVSGVVSVQARQTLEETQWLLDIASSNEWILGIVGWVPLAATSVEGTLERFADQSKLKAVRHVVQGEAAGFLDGPEFNRGISLLTRFDLVYDVLILGDQLPEAIRFIDRHPNQVFVLDHIAKPYIKDGLFEPWKTQILELAKRENVFCKLSGIVTEANFVTWTSDSLKPYYDIVLEAFGPSRLMFGSDWPVCLAACNYARWIQIVQKWTAPMSDSEKRHIFQNTAWRVYNLD